MSGVHKGDTPRVGDRVLVAFETTVASGAPNPYLVWVAVPDGVEGPERIVCVPTFAVEVLERADDPSQDDAGTLRREDHEENGFSLWQATQDRSGRWYWLCVYSTAARNRGDAAYHEDVAGLPVVGATPWTPAWEAERAEVDHADSFPPEQSLPPLHVDNEAIVLGQDLTERARQRRQPRVFRPDGSEPPADVECVRFFGTPAHLNSLFLRRSVDRQLLWVWVADPMADVTSMVGDTNWPVPNVTGEFTEEVLS